MGTTLSKLWRVFVRLYNNESRKRDRIERNCRKMFRFKNSKGNFLNQSGPKTFILFILSRDALPRRGLPRDSLKSRTSGKSFELRKSRIKRSLSNDALFYRPGIFVWFVSTRRQCLAGLKHFTQGFVVCQDLDKGKTLRASRRVKGFWDSRRNVGSIPERVCSRGDGLGRLEGDDIPTLVFFKDFEYFDSITFISSWKKFNSRDKKIPKVKTEKSQTY